ncbi:hypothetical protein Y032_0098g3076 [Ancylostoma ceylanicum]|uniref:Uncharacterized protein n=1 Tax=Ancylostoma ceylanicum TaxID=53326 RepID=A0A016TIB5_9BILA|nr:hypothetical protein Y032_0098g3076 [Ancylostoma ceylanicum]
MGQPHQKCRPPTLGRMTRKKKKFISDQDFLSTYYGWKGHVHVVIKRLEADRLEIQVNNDEECGETRDYVGAVGYEKRTEGGKRRMKKPSLFRRRE